MPLGNPLHGSLWLVLVLVFGAVLFFALFPALAVFTAMAAVALGVLVYSTKTKAT